MKARLIWILAIMAAGFMFKACEGDMPDLFSNDPRDGLTGDGRLKRTAVSSKRVLTVTIPSP